MKRRRWLVITGATLVFLGVVAFVAHDAIIGAALRSAAAGAGYAVSYDRLHVGTGRTELAGVDVRSASGEPLLTAQHVAVDYSLSDLVRRSPGRLFGLVDVEIDHPHLTLVHHPDGTWNFPAPSSQGNSNTNTLAIPNLKLRVIAGTASLTDTHRRYKLSRALGVDDLNVYADFRPNEVGTWSLSLALLEGGGRYKITGKGRLDPQRGFEINRVSAPNLPIGPLVNYALDSSAVNVANGALHGLDACYCALLGRDGVMGRHLTASADLQNLDLYLGGLAKPVRNGHGRVFVYDDGLTVPSLAASIADIPVRVAGGITGFSGPQFHLGVLGTGRLTQLTSIAGPVAANIAVAGNLHFGLLVEGEATNPLLFARFASPGISYGGYQFEAPRGLVALSGTDATLIDARLRALGIDVGARGTVALGKHTDVEVAGLLRGPTDRLPYAAAAVPGLAVDGAAVVSGRDSALAASGEIDGASATQTLATTFAIDGTGTGEVGPFRLNGRGGESLLADVFVDRPHSEYAAVVDARSVTLSTARLRGVPGLPTLPPADAVLDAQIAAVSDGKHALGAGSLAVPSAHLRGVDLGRLRANGSSGSDGSVALQGRYRGNLASLAALAGGTLAAGGGIDLPFAVAYAPSGVIAQIDGGTFSDARVAGVEVRGLSGTVGVRGRAYDIYDVYGLTADLGSGSVTADGSFGDGGTLHVSTSNLDLRPIAAAFHAPLQAGRLTALAELTGTLASPNVTGGVALSGGRVTSQGLGIGVAASAGLAYANDRLRVENGSLDAGPAVASLDADIDGVRSRPAHTSITADAHVRDADIATLARIARAPVRYPTGILDADVHASGYSSAPLIAGTVAVPEGSVNGLAFRRASVALAGTASDLHARTGRVTVGSSTLAFDADVAGASSQRFGLHAPHVDLADFNDYFDRGDTLGGAGSLDVAVARTSGSLTTSGRIDLRDARYTQIRLGDAGATWSTRGRTVNLAATLGGDRGRISADGAVTLAAGDPLRDALHRTTLDVRTNLTRLDLGTWLPTFGIRAPVVGYLDAGATVRGRYPGLAVTTTASLADATIGRIPVQRASFAATASAGRATITSAVFDIPNLSVEASGYVGLTAASDVALDVRAQSPDIGALAKTATGQTYPVHGTFDVDASARGRVGNPDLGATIDGTKVAYQDFTIPRVHAQASLRRSSDPHFATLAVQTAEVDLTKGSITASGTAPLRLSPRFLVRQGQPVALDVKIAGIDLMQFGSALPKGTKLGGTLDGNVDLGGTLRAPSVMGQIVLARGSYVGPAETNPISNLGATLAFGGTSAQLSALHADVGGGTLDGSGSASVPDLRDPAHDLAFNFQLVANHAVIDAPQYLKGRVDGTLTIGRAVSDPRPTLGGALAVQNARIPLTAIFNPSSPAATSTSAPPDVALALDVKAVHDVRIQSGQVDIGALGQAHAGGTVAAPTLAGEFDATDGTVSFYRTFRLQSGTVAFSADNGVIPTVDASATTTLTNPETFVTLGVRGLATQLNVDLTSDPSYSRDQILGLLLGLNAFGAVNGVAAGGQQTGGVNPITGIAQGQLGTLLTRNVLEPLGANLGGAVGLQSLAINYDPFGGGLDVGAQKKLFKNVSAVFAESFNYPTRSSLGLLAKPNDRTAVQLTFFSQQGSGNFTDAPTTLNSTAQSVTASQPANGTSGFSFSLQRKY